MPNSENRLLKIKIKTSGIYFITSTFFAEQSSVSSLKRNEVIISQAPIFNSVLSHTANINFVGELKENDIISMNYVMQMFELQGVSFSIMKIKSF